jgi:hypothetical protein
MVVKVASDGQKLRDVSREKKNKFNEALNCVLSLEDEKRETAGAELTRGRTTETEIAEVAEPSVGRESAWPQAPWRPPKSRGLPGLVIAGMPSSN